MKSYNFNYTVRLDDLDYMGIVGNAEWITIMTRARIDLLDRIHFPITEMIKREMGGVVTELNVMYKTPSYYGDNVTVTITPYNPFKKGLYLKYHVVNQNNAECISADVKIIFVDKMGRSALIPEEISMNLFGLSSQDIE